MLNYIEPTYDISTTPSGIYKVVVSTKIGTDLLEKTEETRERTLIQEAEKSSLFAMAFIQKLASDGDSQALAMRTLYQAYHRFIENSDKEQLQESCDKILNDKSANPLAQNFAKYVNAVLKGQQIDPSLEDARALLNKLIPGIERALTIQLPQKIYEEQEVIISEIEAQHKAFPDLVNYCGHYYACFREANSHVGYNDFGKIRILKGDFNEETKTWKWEHVALLSKDGYDLRDPKFFVNHVNALQIIMGGSKINDKNETTMMIPHVAHLENDQWDLSEAIIDQLADGSKGQWIWRVTWNPYDNNGYAFSYGRDTSLSLMKTADGVKFKKIADIACEPLTDLSEGTLRFKSDGTAIALIRTRRNAIIGSSTQNDGYTKWSLTIVPFRVGGPNFLISKKEQKMWAATRHFFLNEDNTLDEATIIGSMDAKSLTPVLRLKSNFDNGYPGMVLEQDGSATVIYYSSESENKSNLYITRVKLPD